MLRIAPGRRSAFRLIAASLAGFLAASLFNPAESRIRKPEHLRIEFLKPKPGQDYVAMERQIWRAIQQDRVSQSQIRSWSVYQLVPDEPGSEKEYEFVVLTVSDRPLPRSVPYQANMARALPGMDPLEIAKKTAAARVKVKLEDFKLVDSVPE